MFHNTPSIMSEIVKLKFVKAIADAIELPSELYSTEIASKYVLTTLFFPQERNKEHARLITSLCLRSPYQRELMYKLTEHPVNVEPNEWKIFTKLFTAIPFHEVESIVNNKQLMDFHQLLSKTINSSGGIDDKTTNLTGHMVGDRLCKLFTMYMKPSQWTTYWTATVGSLDSDIGEVNRNMKPTYPRIDSELLFSILDKLDESDKKMVTKY